MVNTVLHVSSKDEFTGVTGSDEPLVALVKRGVQFSLLNLLFIWKGKIKNNLQSTDRMR
jgi:hypothetical protein